MKKMLPLAMIVAALLVGLGAGRAYHAHTLTQSAGLVVTRGDYDHYLARAGQVAFYSLKTCGVCDEMRGLLREQGVDYVERPADGSASHRRELHQLGAKRVPVIVLDGYKLEGYDADRTIALLKEHGYIIHPHR